MSSRMFSSFECVPVFVGGKTWGYSEISEGSNSSWNPVTPESSSDSSSMWTSKAGSSSPSPSPSPPPPAAPVAPAKVGNGLDESSLCVGDVLSRAIEAEMKLEESEKRAWEAEEALLVVERKLQKSDMECGRILQMLINAKGRIREMQSEQEERYKNSKVEESDAWRLLERSMSIGESIRNHIPKKFSPAIKQLELSA